MRRGKRGTHVLGRVGLDNDTDTKSDSDSKQR